MSLTWRAIRILIKLEMAVGRFLAEILASVAPTAHAREVHEGLGISRIPGTLRRVFSFVNKLADRLVEASASSLVLRPLAVASGRYGAASPVLAVPLAYALYLALALVSPLPIVDPALWVAGIALWTLAVAAYSLGARAAISRVPGRAVIRLRGEGLLHFSLPLLIAGGVGLLVNYLRLGAIPLLYPELRRHDAFWMISYDAYLLGLSALVAWLSSAAGQKGSIRREDALIACAGLMGISLALTFPSGFRLDMVVALGTLIVAMWLGGLIKVRQVLAYLAAPGLLMFTFQKVILMARAGLTGDAYYVLVSRAGFTLYSLTLILKTYSPWGMTYGILLFINPLLTMLGIPRPLVGALTGEAVVGLPVAYTTSMVGPIWIDFGVVGVAVVPLVLGAIAGGVLKLARSGDSAAKVLYPILLSASLVWIESGPVHPYLYSFFAPALALLVSGALRRGGDGNLSDKG